jgi:hypothetical protein
MTTSVPKEANIADYLRNVTLAARNSSLISSVKEEVDSLVQYCICMASIHAHECQGEVCIDLSEYNEKIIGHLLERLRGMKMACSICHEVTDDYCIKLIWA